MAKVIPIRKGKTGESIAKANANAERAKKLAAILRSRVNVTYDIGEATITLQFDSPEAAGEFWRLSREVPLKRKKRG